MLFNGLGVLVMLPFVGLYEKGLEQLVPERPAVSQAEPMRSFQ
jgi:hypothetical protein